MSKLLVVVDYQKDFVDGTLGFKKAETLEDGIVNKIEEYLSNGDKVLFTYDTHYEDYLSTREGINLPVKHCIIDTEGHELYGKLTKYKDAKNTIHINKKSFGIAPEDMINIKNELGEIKDIEIVGIVTNMCVISNAVTFQSAYVNANISVIESLCASFVDELHDKAMDVMKSLQVKVL